MGTASPADGSFDGLVGHVRATRVVVVGGGVSGLVASLECAKVGLSVTVLDAASHLGGALRTVEVAGCAVDAGADRFSTRGGAVERLADDLGISDDVIDVAPDEAWVAGIPGGAAPLPRAAVAGIPENPWDEGVRRVIGWGGAWRAFVDRMRPPLTIGQERSLGRLVRNRMGERVLDRLVAPLSIGVYGVHPDDVDVEEAAPGLSAALTRTGSLAGGVAQVRGGLDDAPLKRFAGGMSRLADALHARLAELGADVRTGVRVERVERSALGGWTVTALAVEGDTAGGVSEDGAGPRAEALEFAADIVIVATPGGEARRLLAPHVSALAEPEAVPDELEVVTLVVEGAAVAGSRLAGQRSAAASAVYPLSGASPAVAVTSAAVRTTEADPLTAVRVVFGSRLARPATADLDEAAAVAAAVAAASDLLGTPLPDAVVRGARRDRFALPVAGSLSGRREATAAVRAAVAEVSGLAVVGAWLSGAGLARVVPDAEAEADRARRAAVFGRGAPAEE